jgi:hypothetical protein
LAKSRGLRTEFSCRFAARTLAGLAPGGGGGSRRPAVREFARQVWTREGGLRTRSSLRGRLATTCNGCRSLPTASRCVRRSDTTCDIRRCRPCVSRFSTRRSLRGQRRMPRERPAHVARGSGRVARAAPPMSRGVWARAARARAHVARGSGHVRRARGTRRLAPPNPLPALGLASSRMHPRGPSFTSAPLRGCESSPRCVLGPRCSAATPSVLRPCDARFSLANGALIFRMAH